MDIDWVVIATIVGPILGAFAGIYIQKIAEKRPRVIGFLGHASAFTLGNAERTVVHTHSFIVRNAGKKTAKNVRIGHYVLPRDFSVHPPVQYSIETLPDGTKEILIPQLIPGEQVTVSYLYFPPLIWNQISSHNKHDDGYFKIISVIPAPQLKNWQKGIVMFLIWAGLVVTLYIVYKFFTYFFRAFIA